MTTSDPTQSMPRVSTGSAQVDEILGGGFPVNSINVIMGAPGTGKTVLAEQMVFHNAGGRRPVLYLSTLAEPMAKMVRYLQQFRFYDADKLGKAVIYDELGPALIAEGIAAVVPRVLQAIQQLSPSIIVIDSFKALHDLAESTPQMRRMIGELAGLLTAYQTTAFLVGEYAEGQVATYPEFAVADGIVQLLRLDLGTRQERYLQVLKLRGSKYLEGLHAFRLGAAGLEVFPRLVSPPTPESYQALLERIPSGVAGLDAMLGGGLWRGSTTLLTGPTGSGKTTLAAQFVLEGVRRGEPSLFLHFEENPTQLARLFTFLGADPAELQRKGLHLRYASPVELQIDSLVVDLFRTVEQKKLQRVAIDGIANFENAAADLKRVRDYLYGLVQHLAVRNVACWMTLETPEQGLSAYTGPLSHAALSPLADTIVRLEIREVEARLERTVRAVKSRGSTVDATARRIEIGSEGVKVC